MTSRRWKIIYWISTMMLLLPFGLGGVLDILAGPNFVALMAHLGYPVYFLQMLGVAKLLGMAAVLTNRWRTLKEWAYAGMTFDAIGAGVSHVASGEGLQGGVTPLVVWAVVMVSHGAWRRMEKAG